MFKAGNKNTRTTSSMSFWCFSCELWIYFTSFLVFLLLNLSKSTKSPEDVICAQNIWFQLSKKVLRNIYSKLSFWNFEQLFLDVSIAFFHQNHRTNYYFFMKEAEIFFSWVYILFRFNVCVKSNSSCKIKKKSTKQVKK